MDVNAVMERTFIIVGYTMTALVVVLVVYALILEAVEHHRREVEQRRRARLSDERAPLRVVRRAYDWERDRDGVA